MYTLMWNCWQGTRWVLLLLHCWIDVCQNFRLMVPFPRKVFETQADLNMRLQEAGWESKRRISFICFCDIFLLWYLSFLYSFIFSYDTHLRYASLFSLFVSLGIVCMVVCLLSHFLLLTSCWRIMSQRNHSLYHVGSILAALRFLTLHLSVTKSTKKAALLSYFDHLVFVQARRCLYVSVDISASCAGNGRSWWYIHYHFFQLEKPSFPVHETSLIWDE